MNKRGVKENSDEIKKILRPSSDRDIDTFRISKERERAAQARSRELVNSIQLTNEVE
jgi:hypothetical protein